MAANTSRSGMSAKYPRTQYVSLCFISYDKQANMLLQEIEADTRMPDEVGYQTHLVDYDQAMQLLAGTNLTDIVDKAYRLWHATHRQIHNPAWQETVRTKLGIDPASVAAQVPPFPVQNVDEGRRSRSSAEGREDGRTAAL